MQLRFPVVLDVLHIVVIFHDLDELFRPKPLVSWRISEKS
jgi:hypothetical protein